MTFSQIYSNIKFAAEPAGKTGYAVVAQSVERFLGKEEVRQFKSAQQLQEIGPLKFQRSFFIAGICGTASLKVKKYEREEV